MFKFATTFRCCSFWVLFCINLLWFVLTVAFAFSGLNPINDDNIGDVGLVIPEDTYQRRANAYEVAKDEADLTLAAAKCAREDASNPIEMIAMKGRFEKEGNGNALTKSSLEELRDHENHIMSEDGWKDRCKLIYTETYPACEVFIGSSDPSPFSPANEFGCQKPFSPVYMFEKYGDPYFDDIPGTLAKIEESTVDWLAFTDMLHKDFNSNNRRSKIMTSTTYVGTPRHEVEFYVKDPERLALIENGNAVRYYDKKHEEREADHIEHWVVENLGDWFQKRFEDTPLRILFAYDGYDPVSDIVIEDLSLLIVALIIVILYMWIYTGSLFITTMGIFQILMSFFGANLLYRYIWPTEQGFGYDYFTLFCALSLFIIVGIGADDIFVYFDTWQGSATHHYKTVAHRMSQVYSHACVAMAVTSATTIFAFLSNLSSPFIGIRTFGVFSALLVTVNYCAVITFFPVVVLVYDNYFRHKKYWWDPCWQRYCKPILSKCLCCCGKAAPDSDDDIKQQDVVDAKEKSDVDDASVALEDEEEEKEKEVVVQEARASDAVSWNDAKPQRTVRKQDYEAAMPLFFREKYAPFLTSKAKIICALLVAVWIVFLAFACLIQVKPFLLYELLPSTHNFHQYTFVTQNWKTKSSAPLFVHVLFGLEHRDPLNTHGIPAQRFEISTSGEANFDSAFELDSIGAQNQLYEVAEEFIKNPRKGLKIDVRNGINTQLTGSKTGSLEFTPDNGESSSLQNPYGVQSFMHAMASWYVFFFAGAQ